LIPLFFGACNSSSQASLDVSHRDRGVMIASSSSTNSSSVKSHVSQNKRNSISHSAGGVAYIAKPIVLEEGMFHIKEFMKTLSPILKQTLAQDKSGITAMGCL